MYRFLVVTSVMTVAVLVLVISLAYEPSTATCRIANESECSSLDPHLIRWVHENRAVRALYEGLTAADPVTTRPGPGVAERWDISPDGRTYTFHFRADARWSNGDAVTAEDFHWSWERALNPRIGAQYSEQAFYIKNARAYYESIRDHDEDPTQPVLEYAQVGVRVVDPRTLVVELENPCAYFLEITALSILWPVHRPTYERLGAYHWPVSATSSPGQPYDAGRDSFTTRHLVSRAENIVCNGAYVVESWQFKRHLRLRKNPYYWNRDQVAIHQIELLPIDDAATSFMVYETGGADWTSSPTLRLKRALYEQWQAGNRPDFYQAPSYATYYYILNCTKPPFDDVRVRRAFCMAVDKAQLCRDVTGIGEVPARVFVPPHGREASAKTDAEGRIHYYDQPQGLPHDVEAARRELVAAGWSRVDGRFERNGEAFPVIEILYNTLESHNLIAQAIGKMWEEAFGTTISLRNVETTVYDELRSKGDYMVARYGWFGDFLDPDTFLSMYRSDSGFNDTGWKNARYDDLLNRAANEPDPGKRFSLLTEAETLLVEKELPIIPLYHYVGVSLHRPYLKGVTPNIRDWLFLKALSINRGQPL